MPFADSSLKYGKRARRSLRDAAIEAQNVTGTPFGSVGEAHLPAPLQDSGHLEIIAWAVNPNNK